MLEARQLSVLKFENVELQNVEFGKEVLKSLGEENLKLLCMKIEGKADWNLEDV